MAAFLILAVVFALVAFNVVRGMAASWRLTGDVPYDPILPTAAGGGILSATLDPNATPPAGPLEVVPGPTPQAWDGVSRVNILIMGLDYADTEERRVPRTDTMILFTMDPLSKTAGMLTIPRDLWVNIPDFDYGKINTAFFLGESWKMPGGGAGMAVRTVEQLLGVPINYYAQIDFYAFTEFIDNIGGIELNIPEEITVDPVGQHNTVILKPGKQMVGGAVALAYARNRYTANGDFDRSGRQLQVIMAIRDRIVNLNMLPILITKAPQIYNQLSTGIHTNLTLNQTIQLALLGQQISKENIKQAVIGPGEVVDGTSPDGLAIEKPITDKIRLKRDEIFTTGGPVGPAAVAGDPVELMKAENSRVSVSNATGTPGLAARTSDYLKSQGVNVMNESNAELSSYTRIILYSAKPYTLAYLAKLMNVPTNHIFNSTNTADGQVDVVVILGNDWAQNNPMPAQ